MIQDVIKKIDEIAANEPDRVVYGHDSITEYF